MAFNNWDKLRKAQRDYPKPNKVAESFVRKALKKSPKNPFLLAWEANLLVQWSCDAETAIEQVQQAWQQPGSNDFRLLSYLYETLAEATRRSRQLSVISSVGDENSKVWQNAAKTLVRKQEREDLWSGLAKVTLREECWEDFRLAVVQYNKEIKEGTTSTSVKKHAHCTQILAIQLAAEQQHLIRGGEHKYKIYSELARRLVRQAYEAPQDDPIAFKDIQDLRFMGEIYARQKQCRELIELWSHPPVALQNLMATHQDDLWGMRIGLLSNASDWPLVESQCLAYIEFVLSKSTQDQGSKFLWESCAWKIETWTYFLYAVSKNHSPEGCQSIVTDILNRAFGNQLPIHDRSLRLVYMMLLGFMGRPIQDHCKIYWEHHSGRIVCFADMYRFFETMGYGDRLKLMDFIKAHAEKHLTSKDAHIVEQNTLRMIYYLQFSSMPPASTDKRPLRQRNMEMIFRRAVMSPWSNESNSSIGVIAIYTLLQLHRDAMWGKESHHPLLTTPNSRLLLQAAMLARHLVACDKEKQDRTLALLAARLHLNLGLGKCAFQLYRFTKCKEMLLHTLSPYVLSRISLTHPFGADGREGFSAEEELEKVMDAMNRMENKVEDTLIPDLRSITWDKTIGLLDLKHKFKSSLSRLICITERCRVARLKGEAVGNLPTVDLRRFESISDNTADVFPNYDSVQSGKPISYIMPNMLPDAHWMLNYHETIEVITRVLYKEAQTLEYIGKSVSFSKGPTYKCVNTPAETTADEFWEILNDFVEITIWEEDRKNLLTSIVKEIPAGLHVMRLAMEKLRMPSSTTRKLEDEPAMFHENMLISCYTKLELLRALNKGIEYLREKVVNPKSTHFMKAKLPKNWVTEVDTEVKICYEAIRHVARSYIDLIKEKGEAAIKAQIRWGETGQILKKMLSDADVALYAREYVDSALQAWEGVLKVKLK